LCTQNGYFCSKKSIVTWMAQQEVGGDSIYVLTEEEICAHRMDISVHR
jgi:hypothetical protein